MDLLNSVALSCAVLAVLMMPIAGIFYAPFPLNVACLLVIPAGVATLVEVWRS